MHDNFSSCQLVMSKWWRHFDASVAASGPSFRYSEVEEKSVIHSTTVHMTNYLAKSLFFMQLECCWPLWRSVRAFWPGAAMLMVAGERHGIPMVFDVFSFLCRPMQRKPFRCWWQWRSRWLHLWCHRRYLDARLPDNCSRLHDSETHSTHSDPMAWRQKINVNEWCQLFWIDELTHAMAVRWQCSRCTWRIRGVRVVRPVGSTDNWKHNYHSFACG